MSRKTTGERVVYSLSVDLPPGVSCTQMVKYIEAALSNYFDDREPSGPKPDLKHHIKLLERHVKYS